MKTASTHWNKVGAIILICLVAATALSVKVLASAVTENKVTDVAVVNEATV